MWAVQKKLLNILYSLWNTEKTFDPEYQTSNKPEEQPETNEQTPQTKTAPTVAVEAAEGRSESRMTPKTPVNSNSKKSGT
jgi:hypothetical protein